MGSERWWIGAVIGFGLWHVPRVFFGVPSGAMLSGAVAIAIAAGIGFPVGLFAAYYLTRDEEVDTLFCRVIAGTNLVAWVIPVAGFAVSVITWQFSRHSRTAHVLYCGLSTLGGLIALAKAGIGGVHAYTSPQDLTPAADMSASSGPAEHSTERCAFAAIESWPDADFNRYCR